MREWPYFSLFFPRISGHRDSNHRESVSGRNYLLFYINVHITPILYSHAKNVMRAIQPECDFLYCCSQTYPVDMIPFC
jgi:hypothetical protein